MRLINNEKQPLVVSFTDAGVPKAGLTPVIVIYKVSDGTDVTPVADTLTELGNGLYKYPSANLPDTSDDQLSFMIDGTATITDDAERYKFGAIVFGGYPNTLLTLLGSAVVQQPTASVSASTFSRTIADIIQMAHRAFGEKVLFHQETKELLQSIVLNLQGMGYFFWMTDQVVKTFTAPSEVVGTDGLNYTCYLSHTSSSDTEPITGAEWTKYWYEAGEDGGVWADDTAYAATGDFYPEVSTFDIEQAYVRYNNEDCPVKIIDEYTYSRISDKQETGQPAFLYFEDRPTPRCFLWPQIRTDVVGDYLLVYTRMRKAKNINGYSQMDNDFRQVWFMPLLSQLIAKMAEEPRRNIEIERILLLQRTAEKEIDNARSLRTNLLIQREGDY